MSEKQKSITGKRIVISTTVSLTDYEYVKKHNLMFSRLLENAISIHRVAEEEGVKQNYHSYLKNKISVISERLTEATTFIQEKGLSDEFVKKLND